MLKYWLCGLLAVGLLGGADIGVARGDQPSATKADVATLREKGVNFLKTAQAADGSWTSPDAPGVSGLVLYGLLSADVKSEDPAVQKAVKHLLTFAQPDGGIYNPKTAHASYETSIVIMALNALDDPTPHKDLLAKADKFVRGIQWDTSENITKEDVRFGGAGYGRTGDRPDLSNTVFLVEALKANGAKADDPALHAALVFISRCQNLESEFNTTPNAPKVNDGGFYYTPALGGQSQAGTTPEGGLRSYASMTYAGLKSMIYAGLDEKDPRVKAALEWITKHYSVAENPGMGATGLYYYYQTFAKTLAVAKIDTLEDAQGKKHDWRSELVAQLKSTQQPNGSWVNSATRWYEGDPNLVTAYVLMTLKYCDPR